MGMRAGRDMASGRLGAVRLRPCGLEGCSEIVEMTNAVAVGDGEVFQAECEHRDAASKSSAEFHPCPFENFVALAVDHQSGRMAGFGYAPSP